MFVLEGIQQSQSLWSNHQWFRCFVELYNISSLLVKNNNENIKCNKEQQLHTFFSYITWNVSRLLHFVLALTYQFLFINWIPPWNVKSFSTARLQEWGQFYSKCTPKHLSYIKRAFLGLFQMQNVLTSNVFLISSLNTWSLVIIFYYSLAIQTHWRLLNILQMVF